MPMLFDIEEKANGLEQINTTAYTFVGDIQLIRNPLHIDESSPCCVQVLFTLRILFGAGEAPLAAQDESNVFGCGLQSLEFAEGTFLFLLCNLRKKLLFPLRCLLLELHNLALQGFFPGWCCYCHESTSAAIAVKGGDIATMIEPFFRRSQLVALDVQRVAGVRYSLSLVACSTLTLTIRCATLLT